MIHTKSLLCAVAAVTVCSFLATAHADDSVYSVNVVGFQKKELPPAGEFILSAPPFEKGQPATLLSIFGTNTLKQNDVLLNCDRIVMHDPDEQTYQAWAQWTDGVFYKANNAAEWAAGIAGNPEVPTGTGFWIVSASDSAPERAITYAGDVVFADSQSVGIIEGFQILAYPFSSDILLQDTSFFDDGAANNDVMLLCDRVHVYRDGSYQAYALWTDGQWYKANNAAEWAAGILATNMLSAGEGFFYEARASITWAETNKYLGALSE